MAKKAQIKLQKNGSKPHGYWTKARCIEDAKKYANSEEWKKNSPGASAAAHQKGWLEECKNKNNAGMPYGPRAITQFLLEHDIKFKAERRFKESPVVRSYPFDFHLPDWNLIIEYHGLQHKLGRPNFDGESNDDLRRRDQIKKDWCKAKRICYLAILDWEIKSEKEIIAKVLAKLGTIAKIRSIPLDLVKRALTSAEKKRLESKNMWSLESCILDAKKYKSKSTWSKNSHAYTIAWRKGWLNLCCKHMKALIKSNGYWTLAALKADARKYKTRTEWIKNSSGYGRAHAKGWLDLCWKHMTSPKKPEPYWTYERIVASTKGFKNKGYSAWKQANTGAYTGLIRHKRYDEIKALFNVQDTRLYWTFERIASTTRGFKNKGYTAWKQANTPAYAALKLCRRYDEIKALFN